MEDYWTKKCIDMLKDIVSIPSVNPLDRTAYDTDTYGEQGVVDYIDNYFRRCDYNFNILRVPVLPNRENLLICTDMDGHRETLLLETHSDTVEGENMVFPPFNPFIENGRLYGRGSCDAKGQLAAMVIGLEMALELTKGNLPVDVSLMLAADEEHVHRGVDKLADIGFRAKGAVVGEPTNLQLSSALKGCIRFKIVAEGISAHTSIPYIGKNAIYLMSKVIHIIEKKISPQVEERVHLLCGRSTVCVSLINGGQQANIVPDRCEVHIDRRLNPGECWEEAYNLIEQEIINGLSQDEKNRILFSKPYLIDPSMETDASSDIVSAFSKTLKAHRLPHKPVGLPYGCDASKIALLGIPTVVFGPGSIEQAHSTNEFISIADLMKAAAVYRDFIMNFS